MRGLLAGTVGLTVLLLTGHGTAAQASEVQWKVSNGGNGHWYELAVAPTSITWYDAKAAAEAQGGYLVTVTSQAETDFIVSALGGTEIKSAWLGAYQDRQDPGYSEPAGGWKWITGEPWSYTKWLPDSGEPNNVGGYEDWINFHDDTSTAVGYWCDVTWNQVNKGKYVIEWNQVPEPGSITLLLAAGLSLLAYAWRRRR